MPGPGNDHAVPDGGSGPWPAVVAIEAYQQNGQLGSGLGMIGAQGDGSLVSADRLRQLLVCYISRSQLSLPVGRFGLPAHSQFVGFHRRAVAPLAHQTIPQGPACVGWIGRGRILTAENDCEEGNQQPPAAAIGHVSTRQHWRQTSPRHSVPTTSLIHNAGEMNVSESRRIVCPLRNYPVAPSSPPLRRPRQPAWSPAATCPLIR